MTGRAIAGQCALAFVLAWGVTAVMWRSVLDAGAIQWIQWVAWRAVHLVWWGVLVWAGHRLGWHRCKVWILGGRGPAWAIFAHGARFGAHRDRLSERSRAMVDAALKGDVSEEDVIAIGRDRDHGELRP